MASPCIVAALDDGNSNSGDAPERRPSTAAEDLGVKRRAAKACLSCRYRKVRCDVLGSGPPCTNCRLDGVDCVIKKSNRGRKPAGFNARAARQRQSPSPTVRPVPPAPSPPAELRSSVASSVITRDLLPGLFFEGMLSHIIGLLEFIIPLVG